MENTIAMGMDNTEQKESPKKTPFAIWTVGGKDYQLKLRARDIVEVEKKLGRNILSVIGNNDDLLPPLSTLLTIVQASMRMAHHGMTFDNVLDLYDGYCEEGKTQADLLNDVIVPLLEVSGFFTKEMKEALESESMGAPTSL